MRRTVCRHVGWIREVLHLQESSKSMYARMMADEKSLMTLGQACDADGISLTFQRRRSLRVACGGGERGRDTEMATTSLSGKGDGAEA